MLLPIFILLLWKGNIVVIFFHKISSFALIFLFLPQSLYFFAISTAQSVFIGREWIFSKESYWVEFFRFLLQFACTIGIWMVFKISSSNFAQMFEDTVRCSLCRPRTIDRIVCKLPIFSLGNSFCRFYRFFLTFCVQRRHSDGFRKENLKLCQDGRGHGTMFAFPSKHDRPNSLQGTNFSLLKTVSVAFLHFFTFCVYRRHFNDFQT